jgi:hypothetical protein
MDNPNLILDLFRRRLAIINVGLERFLEHLAAYQVEAVQVDWRPPAGGNPELLKKLKKLNQ